MERQKQGETADRGEKRRRIDEQTRRQSDSSDDTETDKDDHMDRLPIRQRISYSDARAQERQAETAFGACNPGDATRVYEVEESRPSGSTQSSTTTMRVSKFSLGDTSSLSSRGTASNNHAVELDALQGRAAASLGQVPIPEGPVQPVHASLLRAALAAARANGGSMAPFNPFLGSPLPGMNNSNPPLGTPGNAAAPPPLSPNPTSIESAAIIAHANLILQAHEHQRQSNLLFEQARQQQLLMASHYPSLQGQLPNAASMLLPPPRPIPASLALGSSMGAMYPPSFGGDLNRPVRTADLTIPSDANILSDHQALLRQQIEFFEAGTEDIRHFTPGRRREISVGQVGIRCKHCAYVLRPHERATGCVYFPSSLRALYQAGQNMGIVHLINTCPLIPMDIKRTLRVYTEMPAVIGHGGKKYWADGATIRGIYETEQGLRFRDDS